MREIKFRAWNKETKKICDEMTLAEHLNMEMNNGIAMGSVGMKQTKFDEAEQEHNHLIFMQYTGLKDKNGKEVYEEDIIKIEDYGKRIGVIKHGISDGMIFGGFYIESDHLLNPHNKTLEVIGNIYENPELVKD